MKINKITGLKASLGILAVAGTVAFTTPMIARNKSETPQQDTFEYVDSRPSTQPTLKSKLVRWAARSFSDHVALPPAVGSAADSILAFAPDPRIIVQGEEKFLTFAVDVTNNILYHYDKDGNPIMGYRIASGKLTPEMQTDEGLRIVSHIETYPYNKAPAHTKRHKNPRDYGPKCIILDTLDPLTGKKGITGEFIHGNKDATCIGKHVSQGCMRMDNTVIKDLANNVKRGDLIKVFRRVR